MARILTMPANPGAPPVCVPVPALPARPSSGWRSDIAGTAPQAAARPARRSPSGATCARPRQAGARLRPETGRGALWHCGIRQGSLRVFAGESIPDDRLQFRTGKFAAVGRQKVAKVLDQQEFLLRPIRLRGEPRKGFNAIHAGHLSLRHRAGLPLRWVTYRAIGPECQVPHILYRAGCGLLSTPCPH